MLRASDTIPMPLLIAVPGAPGDEASDSTADQWEYFLPAAFTATGAGAAETGTTPAIMGWQSDPGEWVRLAIVPDIEVGTIKDKFQVAAGAGITALALVAGAISAPLGEARPVRSKVSQ